MNKTTNILCSASVATSLVASVFATTLILTTTVETASAQPGNAGYAPPAAPAPARYSAAPYRFGLTLGVELGLGSMTAESGPIVCEGCSQEPVAVAASFEIGLA